MKWRFDFIRGGGLVRVQVVNEVSEITTISLNTHFSIRYNTFIDSRCAVVARARLKQRRLITNAHTVSFSLTHKHNTHSTRRAERSRKGKHIQPNEREDRPPINASPTHAANSLKYVRSIHTLRSLCLDGLTIVCRLHLLANKAGQNERAYASMQELVCRTFSVQSGRFNM